MFRLLCAAGNLNKYYRFTRAGGSAVRPVRFWPDHFFSQPKEVPCSLPTVLCGMAVLTRRLAEIETIKGVVLRARETTQHANIHIQVAELASLAQLLPPCTRSPTVRNPAPDSSLKSCFSPIASASAAAPRPDCGIRFHCWLPVCLRLQLLLPGPIAASASTAGSPFASASSCCSPIAPASAAARRFHDQQLLPIASASTAASAPRLRPLQLLLARLRPLRLLLPDCILDSSPCPVPMFSNILQIKVQRSRVTIVLSRPTNIPLPSLTDTHTDT